MKQAYMEWALRKEPVEEQSFRKGAKVVVSVDDRRWGGRITSKFPGAFTFNADDPGTGELVDVEIVR